MALATIGSLVVQVDTSSTEQPQVDSFQKLKQCAADHVGGRNKASVLEAAGRAINEAIDRFNARNLTQMGSETQADMDLVDGTATYSLATTFFAMRDVQLIDTDSNVRYRLDYVPWEQWNKQEYNQDKTGRPRYWTARNSFDDGQIIVYPTPDSTAATDYDLRITNFERCDRLNSDSDILDMPRELGPALCWYGGWKLLVLKKGAGHPDTRLARAEWEQWFRDFMTSANRQPAGNEGWYLDWATGTEPPDDGVYVKLG